MPVLSYLKIAGLVAIAIVIAAAWYYYNSSQKKIKDLTERNALLTFSVEMYDQQLKEKDRQIKEYKDKISELGVKNRLSEKELNDTLKRLKEIEKLLNLENIPLEEIESVINEMLNTLFDDIERLTL